jgi:hypothetical protein
MYDLSDEGSQFHRAGSLLTTAYHLLDEATLHLGRTAQGKLATETDQLKARVERVRKDVERARLSWVNADREKRFRFLQATHEQREAGTEAGNQPDVSALGRE